MEIANATLTINETAPALKCNVMSRKVLRRAEMMCDLFSEVTNLHDSLLQARRMLVQVLSLQSLLALFGMQIPLTCKTESQHSAQSAQLGPVSC